MEFSPAAGGGPYTVTMVQSTQSPDPSVQPPPAVLIFGTLEDSGFLSAEAPAPIAGDHFVLNGSRFRVYRVAESDSAGDSEVNGFYLYLDNEEEE